MPEPVTFFFGKRLARRFEFASEDSHHLSRVLRHDSGDVVWAIDGSGTAFEVKLDLVGPRKSEGAIVAEHPKYNEPPCDIVLVQGLILQTKLDWLVEKATELGVTEIRLVSGGPKVGPGRFGRWQRIARSAAKQCRRGRIPVIHEPAPLEDVLATLPPASWRLLADPSGEEHFPKEGDPPTIVLAVGPEKGFSTDDKQRLVEAGFQPISLGIRRLRSETAAVAMLTVVGQAPACAQQRE
jgi:16S rRNA (uracil1498-N3)-methyltransferase